MKSDVTYIAILGFGSSCSDQNMEIALKVGEKLAKLNIGTMVGNITGTFHYALSGAKASGGTTLAVLESTNISNSCDLCDNIISTTDTITKHTFIAQNVSGAIVIGGAEGTIKIINKLIELNKPIVAIKGSGGVVGSKLNHKIIIKEDISHAIKILLDSIDI